MLGISTGWSEDGILEEGEFLNVGTLILAVNAKGVDAAIRAASRAAGNLDFPCDSQLSEGDEAPCDLREQAKERTARAAKLARGKSRSRG